MTGKARNPVVKALLLLRYLADSKQPEWGVRELALATGVSPSSLHRLLTLLAEEGYVQHDLDHGRYQLGPEYYRQAWIATARYPLRQAALPVMQEIVAACDETAVVASYDPGAARVIFVAKVDSSKPLRYALEVGAAAPVHAGASGMAILAFLAESEIQRILSRRLTAMTPRTITNPGALRRELAAIRQRGYAISAGQRTLDAMAVSAPVRAADGQAVGSLLVTVPEYRWAPGDEKRLGPLVVTGAARVSAMLGYCAEGRT